MELVAGEAAIEDVDGFLDRLRAIGAEHGSVVQALDARYVANRDHVERAVALARRARERGDIVADDPAMELLLYAAGTRQIDRALELGVNAGNTPLVIVIDGGNEAGAARSIRSFIEVSERIPSPDEGLLMDWFGIDDTERAATTASLADLVIERVVLLEL